MIYLALVNNITLIISLCILYSLIVHRWEYGSKRHRIISGFLFGAVAVVGMMNPLVFAPGLIFDGRSISISIAGFTGGWVTALIAALMSIAYRIYLGGPGAIMGVSVITASAVIGVAYNYLRKRHPEVVRPSDLILFGVVVHVCMLILTLTLPSSMKIDVLAKIAAPVIIIYPIGTWLVCLVLLEQESRIRAVKELRGSEEKYRQLVEGANSLIIRLDREGRITFFNRFAEQFFGFRHEDIMGKSPVGLIIPEKESSGRDLAAMMDDILRNPGAYTNNENENMRSNGERVWITWANRPVFDRNGALTEILCIGNDITKRKLAEEALKKSEQRFRAIFDSAFQLTGLLTPDGRLIEANQALLDFAGSKFEEIAGRFPWETPCWSGDKSRVARLKEAVSEAAGGSVVRYQVELRGAAGKGAIVDFSLKPVFGEDGVVTMLLPEARDITERLSLESQLQQAQKLESVGRLAGGVAHDFNNMLSVIIGHAELAMGRLGPDQPLFADLMEIRKAAGHSAELTQQLLAFARKQTVAPRVLDLNGTVEGMLRMLRRLIGEDIDLRWLPGTKVWPVKVDPSQVDQVLANLCINARDAIAADGRITIETGVATFDDAYCADHPGFVKGDFVMLVVSDNGHGMDRETLSRIFEPFFTSKEIGQGTGLGLATIYGIVKQNNGFVNVYSEPGSGTTFKIYLPRHMAETAGPLKEASSAPPGRGSETILLVEDEPSILNMAKTLLESFGYRVLPAPTPTDAIRQAEEFAAEIHLLIADVVMPGMNGRDLAENLTSRYPGLKHLFMSGYTANVIAHHGVLDEGVNFIQKPFSVQGLATKVREVLDGK